MLYLVESYVQAGGAAELPPRAANVSPRAGSRLLQSLYVPEDELCLALVEADSAEQAGRASAAAGLVADRILEVMLRSGSCPAEVALEDAR